jgi:hypothetical protein
MKRSCLVLAIACLIVAAPLLAKPVREPLRKPAPAGRFVDRGDYVEDTKTGLLWQKDGKASGKHNFYQAADYAKVLRLGNLTGWRVPTKEKLAAIFPAIDEPWTNTPYNPAQCCKGPVPFDSYWTSNLDTSLPDYAYLYQWYANGGANNCYASRNLAYVRCVHDPVKR